MALFVVMGSLTQGDDVVRPERFNDVGSRIQRDYALSSCVLMRARGRFSEAGQEHEVTQQTQPERAMAPPEKSDTQLPRVSPLRPPNGMRLSRRGSARVNFSRTARRGRLQSLVSQRLRAATGPNIV